MKVPLKCPHCESTNTRFAYQMQSKSRNYCKDCQQHWTVNGKQRDFPISGGKRERRKPEISASSQGLIALECPHCKATDTKFINYQHQNESKPVHFCNNCQRHWTVDCPGGGKRKRQEAETSMADQAPMSQVTLKCPQCESTNTRFAYYHNHKKSQPCHYCKDCRQHWTINGKLRDTPVGGGKTERRQSECSAYDQALVARVGLKCPRCEATSTKFMHYRCKNMSKSLHFCFSCRRHWTEGGNLKDCPNEGKRKIRQPETSILKCPRCESTNTKFIRHSNNNKPKPIHFCKNCRHYWSAGGSLRKKQQLKDPGLQASVEGQEETWHFEGSGEMASVGGFESNVASTECSKSLSPSADNHRPLSVWPEKFNSHVEKGSQGFPFNDEVTPNEEVYLNNGLKNVESPELSYVIENSSCVEKCNSSNDFSSIAKGVEKAHRFSVDVTTTTSRQQIPEPPLESSLPFIKSSFMWPQVESMEVFRSMPQQPHFNPLKEQDEHLREGEAIGLMLSFIKLVEATRKAQLEDSRTIFDMKLKALQILEEHGFSVQPIRSQLVKLLWIKESCGQLNGQLTTVTLEVNAELESVALLDMDIQMLKEKKEMKAFKLAELRRTSVQIEESIRAARSNFDELVAAPW